MVTTAFPRWSGDAQGSFVWEAARAIAAQGANIRVVAMHSPGARPHEFLEGIEVFRPPYLRPERWEVLRREGGGLPTAWRKYKWGRLQLIPFGLVHAAAATRYARGGDLIHAHWTLSAAAAWLGRCIHRRPVLATLQGSDIFQVTRNSLGRQFTRIVLQQCDQITVLSQALARATVAAGIPPDRIQVIPNGVDTRQFVPSREGRRENVILFVGSFIERKGVDHLLSAAPQLLRALPAYRIVLIGEGPQEALLRQIAVRAGIADRVAFLGFLSQDQVCAWMQRAKVLVLPSLEEGLGVVLLEALACGTPVVASNVDGIPDVITGDVGILVPPASPIALQEAIAEVLQDPKDWSDMSVRARARAVAIYDWGHIAAQFMTLYRAILGRDEEIV